MQNIYQQYVNYGAEKDDVNYVNAANIAGVVKVGEAILEHGVI